jgi:hypothetical protein
MFKIRSVGAGWKKRREEGFKKIVNFSSAVTALFILPDCHQ